VRSGARATYAIAVHESLDPGVERRRSAGPLRVLIADDEVDTVDTLARLLRAEGHIVQCAYTGKDVLPQVRIFRPDAIILDVSIPQMSGFAVAQAIRQSFTDVRRPLMIAMSGVWKDFADRRIAEQCGFDHYLEKPADTAELLALLASSKR
jgi:DNA-binding response OmpR family regulator